MILLTYRNAREVVKVIMIDKAKFKYYCTKKNISIDKLADKLGLNVATLYRKIGGSSDFYRHEILAIKEVLNLSVDEMNEIFFTKKLT